MNPLDDPEFIDYMEKFTQRVAECGLRWDLASPAIWATIELATLGFQVSFSPHSDIPGTFQIFGSYNGKVLTAVFYDELDLIDIASSERLPGTTKHYENNRTYFVKVFPAKDCLNASLYLEKLISKTMGHSVNLRYR